MAVSWRVGAYELTPADNLTNKALKRLRERRRLALFRRSAAQSFPDGKATF
jgi:hypothetical protein